MFYLPIVIVFSFILFLTLKKRTKNPKVSLFPNSWVEYTVKHVKFFNKLSSIEQEEFENRIVNFINSTRIIGYVYSYAENTIFNIGKTPPKLNKNKVLSSFFSW